MKFEFVIKCVTTYQDMVRLLRIFVFISLVLSGKTDIVEETTVDFNTAYQPTSLINEVKHNVSQTMRNNFSAVTYNNQASLNFTFKNLAATYSNRFSASSTLETFFKNKFNHTTTRMPESNNNYFNGNDMPESSSLSTEHSNNFSEQTTLASIFPETEIQMKDITSNLEFQNENVTTPVTFEGNEINEMTSHVETVTSLIQNTSTQKAFRIEAEQILNVTSETSKNLSYSNQSSSNDLDENITTTEIPETNTEKHLLNTEVTINALLKNVETSENFSEIIVKNIYSVPTTTDLINIYTTLSENNTQETEISSPNQSTLATTLIKDPSENVGEATSVSQTNQNSMYTIQESSSLKTTVSFNSSVEADNVNEDAVSINQSSVTKNYLENEISTIPTQYISVAANDKQKEFIFKHINNLTNIQRKNMTIDIIFISAVDIVEWFHSYDRVFRNTIASLLTQESQSIPSINIIYIAPTPLKNEKYFCITFMVESTLHKNTYQQGIRVVEKLKQNISGLAETLHLAVESVVAGYNETGKCHKSYQHMQERYWVIIVVLGTILTVAIVVILTMCIQKSRNEKQSWEQDEQEWNATIHGETGRYRSGFQLPINVQNSSNNMVDNLSRVNRRVSLKEENNSFVPNNGVENVLIHNEEKINPETTCGECNKVFIEDTKL